MRKIEVHGTYPFDGRRWVKTASLKPLEAAKQLGVLDELSLEDKKKAKTESLYLFLNKGYVVLGPNAPAGADELGRDLPAGTRAVYLHDGYYSLIEVGHPCGQCGRTTSAAQVYCGAGCCARAEAHMEPTHGLRTSSS